MTHSLMHYAHQSGLISGHEAWYDYLDALIVKALLPDHVGVWQQSLQFRAIEHNVNFWARFGRDNHHYHDQSRSKCAYATPIERNNPQEYDSDGSKHWS